MVAFEETATTVKVTASVGEFEVLVDAFRYQVPDYWRAASYIVYKKTGGTEGWDGYHRPLKLAFTIERKNRSVGYIPRGFLQDLLSTCTLNDFEVDESGLLPRPFAALTPEDLPEDLIEASYPLDDDQRIAIVAWLSEAICINRLAVNLGKTACFWAAAAMVKRRYPKARFLYVTPTERLVQQVYKAGRGFLPDWDITRFGGGEGDVDYKGRRRTEGGSTGKDAVVATAAMLGKHFRRLEREKFFHSFMGLLLDESHHSASPTYQKVILASSAFFRWGASDTIKEDKIAQFSTIKGLVGPVMHEVSSTKLIAKTRSAQPNIYIVDIAEWANRFFELDHQAAPETDAWTLVEGSWKKGVYLGPVYKRESDGNPMLDKKGNPIQIPGYHLLQIDGREEAVDSRWCLLERLRDRGLIRFGDRNRLIQAWAKHYSDKGYPTLVVCTPTLHVLLLEKLIGEAVGKDRVRSLFSDHTSAERDRTFAWVKKPGNVLISPLVKEGVSINEFRAGIVADHVVNAEVANQIIGRFVRKKQEDNRAHLTWFYDRQHPRYRLNCMKLFKRLESLHAGYRFYFPCSGPESISHALVKGKLPAQLRTDLQIDAE